MFNNENNFWVAIWTLATSIIIAFCAFGTYAGHLEDQKVVELVNKGEHPIIAKCALSPPSNRGTDSLICMEALKNVHK